MKRHLLKICSILMFLSIIFGINTIYAAPGFPVMIPGTIPSDDGTYAITIQNANETASINLGATADSIPFGYFDELSVTTTTADYAEFGTIVVDVVASSTVFYAGNGTAAAPSYTFASDTDTGIFRLSANELSFGAGGSEGLRIDFNELEVQPLMTLATGPIELEEDSGAVTAINLPVSATPTAGDEMSITFSIDSNSVLTVKALADSSGGVDNLIVYTPDGVNFGIGTSTPATLLDIYSSATSTITIDSDSATQGACLKLSDFDSSDYTYCVVQDGTMSCSVNSCE